MKNPLAILKPKYQKQQDLKERILKNKEAVLDIMAQNIQGARQCEGLLGGKCIGQFCEKFQEYKTINNDTKQEKSYWRCVYVQTPILLIEAIQNIRRTNELLEVLINKLSNQGGK